MPGRGQSSITAATTAVMLHVTAVILIPTIIKKLEGPPLACSLYTPWAGQEGLSRPLGGGWREAPVILSPTFSGAQGREGTPLD